MSTAGFMSERIAVVDEVLGQVGFVPSSLVDFMRKKAPDLSEEDLSFLCMPDTFFYMKGDELYQLVPEEAKVDGLVGDGDIKERAVSVSFVLRDVTDQVPKLFKGCLDSSSMTEFLTTAEDSVIPGEQIFGAVFSTLLNHRRREISEEDLRAVVQDLGSGMSEISNGRVTLAEVDVDEILGTYPTMFRRNGSLIEFLGDAGDSPVAYFCQTLLASARLDHLWGMCHLLRVHDLVA